MHHKHIEVYVCPNCKGGLDLREMSQTEHRAISVKLYCPDCHSSYPIEEGIPNFIPDIEVGKKHTARSFGYKWDKFQLIDEFYKKNFLDELPPIDYKSFFRGKTVLDAGTGIGIPSFCIAENGAKEVCAIDISNSVRQAYENNKCFDNVRVAKADICNLPFKPNSFDVVVCVAVLQHLPDPDDAFEKLLSCVKPGGTLILWVYAKEGNGVVYYCIEPFRKLVTRNLPLTIVLGMSYFFCLLFQLIIKLVYVPLDKLRWRILPLHEYLVYRGNFNFKMNVQMIFDQLLAPVSYLFTRAEIKSLFDRNGVKNVRLRHHNSNSWTAIGEK